MASWVRIQPHPPSCYAARRCTLIMRARTFVPLERNALSGSWRTSAPISSSQARSSAASLRLFRCSTSRLVRSIRTVVHRSTVRAPPKVAGPYQDPTAADLVAALPARAAPVLDVHRRIEVGWFRDSLRRGDGRRSGSDHRHDSPVSVSLACRSSMSAIFCSPSQRLVLSVSGMQNSAASRAIRASEKNGGKSISLGRAM